MQLHRLHDVTPNTNGVVCRQGRLSGAATSLLFSLILIGGTIFWWRVGAPWFVWGGCGLFAAAIVPMLIGDLRAKLQASNWVIWIRPDGLWVNFRSYQDQSETDAFTVVHLEYREIADVRGHVEEYSTPDDGKGSVHRKLESLEIRLQQSTTQELETALAENRHRKQPERVYLGFIRASSQPSHFPVSLPAPNVIRVAWRGGSNWVVPALRKSLMELAQRVTVAETSRRDQPDWTKLSDAELDDQILELTRSGNRIEAIELLVRRRGDTLTQAHAFVQKLDSRI